MCPPVDLDERRKQPDPRPSGTGSSNRDDPEPLFQPVLPRIARRFGFQSPY